MIDKDVLEARYDELIESLNIGKGAAEDELEDLVNYLHKHSDQRRRPSEKHGLDLWAAEPLGLEKTEYTDADRKLLKKYFQKAENYVLEQSKLLLELLFEENRSDYIKELMRRPLKDELKVHICQLIGNERRSGFEESIISLYLRGTKSSSAAAFECMQSLMNIEFYYPIKS